MEAGGIDWPRKKRGGLREEWREKGSWGERKSRARREGAGLDPAKAAGSCSTQCRHGCRLPGNAPLPLPPPLIAGRRSPGLGWAGGWAFRIWGIHLRHRLHRRAGQMQRVPAGLPLHGPCSQLCWGLASGRERPMGIGSEAPSRLRALWDAPPCRQAWLAARRELGSPSQLPYPGPHAVSPVADRTRSWGSTGAFHDPEPHGCWTTRGGESGGCRALLAVGAAGLKHPLNKVNRCSAPMSHAGRGGLK